MREYQGTLTMKPRDCRAVGKGMSILIRAAARECGLPLDSNAGDEPFERRAQTCQDEVQRWRQARRHAQAVTGLSINALHREAQRRIDKPLNVLIGEMILRVLSREWPYVVQQLDVLDLSHRVGQQNCRVLNRRWPLPLPSLLEETR